MFFINENFEKSYTGLKVDRSDPEQTQLQLFTETSVTRYSLNSISTSNRADNPAFLNQGKEDSVLAQADKNGLLEMENSRGLLFSTQSYSSELPMVLLLINQNVLYPFKPVRLDPEFDDILYKERLQVIRILSTSLRITDGAFELTLNSYGHISFSNRVLNLDLNDYTKKRDQNGQTPLGISYFEPVQLLHQRLLNNKQSSVSSERANQLMQVEAFRSNVIIPLQTRSDYILRHQSQLANSEPSTHQAILGSFATPDVPADRQMQLDERFLNSENLNYKHIGKALLAITRLANLLNEFNWRGVPLKVDKTQLRGSSRNSPLNDGTSSAALYTVTNKRTGEKFQYHGLLAGMIYQYGFAGTPGSDNRLEFADVIRVLELEKHRR